LSMDYRDMTCTQPCKHNTAPTNIGKFLCWKLLSEVQLTLLFAQVIEDSVLDKNSVHFKLQKGLFH
jgi:hypothetical protein